MPMFTVEVTPELIVRYMQTGKHVDIEVLEGIPKDSELVSITKNDAGNLVMGFLTDEPTPYVVIPVIYDKALGKGETNGAT